MYKSSYFKLLLILIMFVPLRAFVQESKVSLSGYVKELYMFYSPAKPIPGTDIDYLTTNIIHNRLNFKWYTSKKLTTVIEMRNRLFLGNLVRDHPVEGNPIVPAAPRQVDKAVYGKGGLIGE